MSKYAVKLDIKAKKHLENITRCDEHKELYKNKAEVILLRSNNWSINDIIKKVGLSKRTVNNYIKDYVQHTKLSSNINLFIFSNNYKNSRLRDINKISEEFRENPPSSYKEAKIRAKNLFEIEISESTIRRYFIAKKIKTSR